MPSGPLLSPNRFPDSPFLFEKLGKWGEKTGNESQVRKCKAGAENRNACIASCYLGKQVLIGASGKKTNRKNLKIGKILTKNIWWCMPLTQHMAIGMQYIRAHNNANNIVQPSNRNKPVQNAPELNLSSSWGWTFQGMTKNKMPLRPGTSTVVMLHQSEHQTLHTTCNSRWYQENVGEVAIRQTKTRVHICKRLKTGAANICQ